jgi:F0F1-type ATP synthase delta subunit
MKRIKKLDPIIEKAVKASVKEGKILEPEVKKILATFKKLPNVEAIYLMSGYAKGLKREQAKSTLILESAIPLTESEITQIKNSLGKKLAISDYRLSINEELLGGVKAKVADSVYDFSVKGKIQQVKEAISG